MGGGGCSLSPMSPARGNQGSLTKGMAMLLPPGLMELVFSEGGSVDRVLVDCKAFLMSLMAAAALL